MTKIRMAATPGPPPEPRHRPLLRYAVLLVMIGLAVSIMLSPDATDPVERAYRTVLRYVG